MSESVEPKTIGSMLPVISRRDFIKGVIVGGAAVSSAGYLFRASTLLAQSSVVGGRLITIDVNGQHRRADVMKQETLAWTLRHKLGLTGTKLGCDRAECGSCTVLIDDVPHYACSVLTHTVRDRKVLTIEGLANADGTLHPIQQGVVEEQGFQCAFCMPGFIMASVGFLKSNPNPTRAQLAQRRLGQSVPMPGLRQNPHRVDARSGQYEEGRPCLIARMQFRYGARARVRRRAKADRQRLRNSGPVREGHRTSEICRGLSCRWHAFQQVTAQSYAACARKTHRRAQGSRDAGC